MLSKWNAELAATVAQRVEAILREPRSHPDWKVEASRRTGGLPAYADMGGVIALTPAGVFVSYNPESRTASPVVEDLWQDVALASLVRQYPDLRTMLPERPPHASDCPHCSGSGWMMDGRLFCRACRGLGWVQQVAP
jgi:hypothetical protein